MPIQVKRLLMLFSVLIVLFFVVRHFLVPDTFGQYGHYRGAALGEIASHPTKYMGNGSCIECHEDEGTLLVEGPHEVLKCEVCHGPGYLHIDNPDENKLHKPRERADCARCHAMNKARPEDVITKQDITNHNPDDKCIECHNPHQP